MTRAERLDLARAEHAVMHAHDPAADMRNRVRACLDPCHARKVRARSLAYAAMLPVIRAQLQAERGRMP